MFWVLLFLFILGSIWGSFLNVLIYRSSVNMSPVAGRSICPKCKRTLRWFHNIPLLSFSLLKGRCAYCHKKISYMYPLVEFLTGLFFVWWFVVGFGFFRLIGSPFGLIQPVFWLTVGMVMLVIFVSDLIYMIIPFHMNLILFTLVALYRIFLIGFGYMKVDDSFEALISGFVLSLFFWLMNKITQRWRGVDGFGMGDILLAPSLGLLLGWPRIVPGIMLSFIFGSLVAIFLLATKRSKLGEYLPFGPFLLLGTVTALIYGNRLVDWYLSLLV